MIPIKYTLSVLLYILLLLISTPAAFIVSAWTRPDALDWGGWFGTYDNPPQDCTGTVGVIEVITKLQFNEDKAAELLARE